MISSGIHRVARSDPRANPARWVRLVGALSASAWLGLAAAAPPKTGDAAPDYVAIDLEGRPISLETYRGKVVVISFWASWCPPCRKELPILEAIQEKAGGHLMQVIAVNTESLDTFRKLARALGQFEILLAHDAGKKNSELYGVAGIPHMVIVDRRGRIVRVNRGYRESELDRIIDDVNQALLAVD